MSQAQTRHPSKEKLAAFVAGRLAAAEQTEMERHIAGCKSCCAALENIPDDTLLDNLRAGKTPLDPFAGIEPNPSVDTETLPRELIDHPRYRVSKLIGKGGMGEVYLAEHRLMERAVALKVLHRAITRDPQAVERFRVEVKAAARLSHPNIVTAFDAEQAADIHFLVMEYIDGISLARYVEKRGPLAVADACNFVRQAALGLQHAFELGMVHRDVKPQNLMLKRNGQIKILDFGLARLAHGIGQDPAYRITELGAVLGTPDYIAPEQVTNSRDTDIRGDIYSLGCTLYFLLAGQTPFPRGSQTQKILAHIDRTPQPLASVRADVPAAVVRIVEKMMAKEPAQRFATPREVAQALAAVGKNKESKQSAPAPRRQAERPAATKTEAKPRLTPRPPAIPSRLKWMLGILFAFLPVSIVLLDVAGVFSLRGRQPGIQPEKAVPAIGKEPGNARKPCVLMVLTHQGFWDPDYRPVRAVLEEKGIDVQVASTAMTPAVPHSRSQGEKPVPVDLLLARAREADCDALYFAGAQDPDYVDGRPGAVPARNLIREMLAAKKHVAALSMGVVVLADAGVLKGKPAARTRRLGPLYPDAADWVRDRPIVVSGTILTGGDFEHGPELAALLAAELLKKP